MRLHPELLLLVLIEEPGARQPGIATLTLLVVVGTSGLKPTVLLVVVLAQSQYRDGTTCIRAITTPLQLRVVLVPAC